MEFRKFYAKGVVPSLDLINFVQRENNKWAQDILRQGFGMDQDTVEQVLNKEVEVRIERECIGVPICSKDHPKPNGKKR